MKLIAAFLTLISLLPVAQAATGTRVQATDPVFTMASVHADRYVHIESVRRGDTPLEIVSLPNGESIEIPVELSAPDEEHEEARETAREMLELTLNEILSDDFDGSMVLGEDGQASVPHAMLNGKPVERINWLKRAFQIKPEMFEPMPRGLKFPGKFKHFSQMAWQFIFVQTYHAGVDYYGQVKTAPKLVEFGASINLKIEPQIFVGRFNPTKHLAITRRSYGFALELSFNKQTKRLAIRTRLRRERGSGGFGLPSLKAEAKIFQTDGTHRPQGGQTWYPPIPLPAVSFVIDRDHGGHYFAQGISIGINGGDAVPGSQLTNTFADYQQIENPVAWKDVPHLAYVVIGSTARAVPVIMRAAPRVARTAAIKTGSALNKTARAILSRRPFQTPSSQVMTCSSLFN